ncbi:hypothetical protein [Streptomyces sp. cg35]|uniref:hypothetical protein n=1 Tax=Streptomyces sp. cg35 TaxID=3421650 RepID=UPI003D1797A6
MQRHRQERDFGVLAQELNRRRGEIHLELVRRGVIAGKPGPAVEPVRVPAQYSPAFRRRRQLHSNTHARWTDAEKARLARRSAEGADAEQLSREFGRTTGAIDDRLVKINATGPAADQARRNPL